MNEHLLFFFSMTNVNFSETSFTKKKRKKEKLILAQITMYHVNVSACKRNY